MHPRRSAIVLATALALAASTRATSAAARDAVSVRADAVAALMQPMVPFRICDAAGRPLTPPDDAAAELLGDVPSVAILDTGASAHLLSHDTASRFGVRAEPGARWVETGMAGEHALAVSKPYTLALEPGGRDGSLRLTVQRMLLNDVTATPAALFAEPGALVDVVGMPALEHAIADMRPADDALAALAVSLLAPSADVRAELWVPLALIDFNHRGHPGNRGAMPSLAPNPVVRGVRILRGAAVVQGDWLLDTGSAVTVVSRAAARALGLHEPAPLSAPIAGISGESRALPGWRVDRVELPATGGGVVALTDVAVFAHDVTIGTDDGARKTLDGLIGVNVLAAFARIVIDVPHARLGLDVAPAAAQRRR